MTQAPQPYGANIATRGPAVSTTSLKLPDDVKRLVADAAASQGVSAHAFMVQAVADAATNARRRAQFVADSVAARQHMLKTGQGCAADEVHAWLQGKAQREGQTACLVKRCNAAQRPKNRGATKEGFEHLPLAMNRREKRC